MKIQLISFVLFAFVSTVVGCSSDDTQTLIPLETSVIRAYQKGDSLTAAMTFEDTNTGQRASGVLNLVVGDIVPNPFGVNCRSLNIVGDITGPSGTINISTTSLFFQDADNSEYECGEFNDSLGRYVFLTDTAASPNGIILVRKSPLQVGDTTTGVSTFDDGTWSDCTRKIEAIENVSIPTGLYESFRVSDTCLYSDGSNHVGTVWVVPGIFELKDSSKVFDMGVFDVVITVTSFNFN